MRCINCNEADLIPARFIVQLTPGNHPIARAVDGFECPNCADRVLFGCDAEELSRDRVDRRPSLHAANV